MIIEGAVLGLLISNIGLLIFMKIMDKNWHELYKSASKRADDWEEIANELNEQVKCILKILGK